MPAAAETLRRTALYERHQAAGARLVPFAGWEMAVQYEGIRQEHVAVRTAAGIFDVSHMGQIETSGPDATRFLQHLLSNDVERLAVGGAQYSVLCNEDGGVLDDLFTYRLEPHRYLTVTNAANHERDLEWLRRHAGLKVGSCDCPDVVVRDAAEDYAMIAVQGPGAHAILEQALEDPPPARMRTTRTTAGGAEVLACGTGYTGEGGAELLAAPANAPVVWDALVGLGATPAGLGARDTLRLEACFHLYGNDLSEDRDPIGAGLAWCCKLETGFVGSEALAAIGEPAERLVPFEFTDRGVPRPGNPVMAGGEEVGIVTSGSHSPCLEVGIGMAYVPSALADPGTRIGIDVRGKLRSAEVKQKPLYESKER